MSPPLSYKRVRLFFYSRSKSGNDCIKASISSTICKGGVLVICRDDGGGGGEGGGEGGGGLLGAYGVRKDGGINRCFLVAITPEKKESHALMDAMIRGMGFVPGEWIMADDMKMNLISAGLMTAASRYPCYVCEWKRGDEDDSAPLRTLEGIEANRLAWVEDGADPNRLKFFKNCRHTPIPIFPSHGLVESFIAPPSLHLILGIVDLLYKAAESKFPSISEWPLKLKIGKVEWQGGHFQGPACRKLLNNVEIFREMVANDPGRSTLLFASSSSSFFLSIFLFIFFYLYSYSVHILVLLHLFLFIFVSFFIIVIFYLLFLVAD